MGFELLAALSAASIAAIASISLCETRLRTATSRRGDEQSSPHSTSGGDTLCIVSGRAQCACGHALNTHRRSDGDACGCNQFEYIGGLVGAAAEEQP